MVTFHGINVTLMVNVLSRVQMAFVTMHIKMVTKELLSHQDAANGMHNVQKNAKKIQSAMLSLFLIQMYSVMLNIHVIS